ncbi:acyl-CoA dehydrogenase family protein [Corynebacterium kroppenstedtii]|uniref:acyl-CoA dehydrogenase family protein n=1 Tax=Corynebacterium kroppenstedtii TaxID=161879 RepID=UPI0026B0CA2E|nr:acyl-CoA dehydrogenase family protein [Corynebacterium kroppenstedtii]MDU7286391.1 acyl-CoA dehydrogenase family protein [Corynebacterium kroppenstedtii]
MSSTNERDNGSGSAAGARDNAAKSRGKNPDGNDSTVGKNSIKRDAMGTAMRLLTRVTGSDFAAKYGLNERIDRIAYESTKTGVKSLGTATREFKRVTSGQSPIRLPFLGMGADKKIGDDKLDAEAEEKAAESKKIVWDLMPDEDQEMIVETIKDFAEKRISPAAHDADEAAAFSEDLRKEALGLGISMVNVPEEFEGIATGSNLTTNFLVTEALAHVDPGIALSLMAPAGVAATLTAYGSDEQQRTYLPAFAGEDIPISAVSVAEPQPLFDPFSLSTTARREGDDVVIEGVKALVPDAGNCELFVVAAMLDDVPTLVIVESDTDGVVVEPDPSMGLRAAGLGRLLLNDVRVPVSNILGGADRSAEDRESDYRSIIRRSRLGWAALAVGACSAVLDYVKPYVNERQAFGEPISHRQAVAFAVANIRIELDGMRLVALRGCSRADQGLSFHREAALARDLAAEKGMAIGSDGVQLLGGHGYTKEHPVERWYRDLRAIGVAEGTIVL